MSNIRLTIIMLMAVTGAIEVITRELEEIEEKSQ